MRTGENQCGSPPTQIFNIGSGVCNTEVISALFLPSRLCNCRVLTLEFFILLPTVKFVNIRLKKVVVNFEIQCHIKCY